LNILDKQKKLLIICGEKSGEMHAAKMCVELLKSDSSVKIIGWGGDHMRTAGVEVTRDISTLAMMGFWEVFKRIFFVKKLFSECKELIAIFEPDVILFVDYSGFNLRMGQWSAQKGFVNHYYIPPKTWAWNSKRTYKLRAFFKKIYTILPFEKPFFESYGMETHYVGNPILESINNQKQEKVKPAVKPLIALIPGSRASEISGILPEMCKLKNHFLEFDFVISGVSSVDKGLYEIAEKQKITVRYDSFYEILAEADYAIVTSGTATLETAMLDVPQIVVFKTSWLTYLIARLFVKIKYISLVNLIADDEVVEELIQRDFNINRLSLSLRRLIKNRSITLQKYKLVRERIGTKNASKQVAKHIINELNN
jgi:lipid-A-disaccharide synthase